MTPTLLPFRRPERDDEPIVITGLGLVTSLGRDRESSWRGIREGRCGIDWLHGVPGLPDGTWFGAQVDLPGDSSYGELKAVRIGFRAAAEALSDARIDWRQVDATTMGCAIAGHMGDLRGVASLPEVDAVPRTEFSIPSDPAAPAWQDRILPNTACSLIADHWGLGGPRVCHSTACASGLISLLVAVRAIRDGQCDIALAGGAEGINPLFAAGFRTMRALAEGGTPSEACLPFDVRRKGFVMGEGGAMFVVERLSHALDRGARIYCSIAPGVMLSEAHHLTGLDVDCDALEHLIRGTLRQASLAPRDVAYVNAHGTGTRQNDAAEIAGISRVFGSVLDSIQVSATKSQIGHLVKAAGCAELAVTILGLRDGIAPPTLGLEQPEPDCRFDCVPRMASRHRYQHALKLSLAFGGHLVGTIVSRWNDARSGFAYPERRRAA